VTRFESSQRGTVAPSLSVIGLISPTLSLVLLEHFPNWRNRKGIPSQGQIMIHLEGW
jgi:hypothetical protein